MKAENNSFIPDTVVVNKGDVVHIDLTAVDKDYAFTQPDYGFDSPIAKGKTRAIEFQAVAGGKITFFCKICGGPEKGPVGYLIVKDK